MILSDFLSQQNINNSNPNKIINISFDMYNILENDLSNINNNNFGSGKYLIQTHSQAKISGTKLLEVHGIGKSLNPKIKIRKTAYLSQTRKIREVMNRSGKSRIKEEEA